eukprot:15146030-Ditylum_brightwellii.AAC.1
MRGKQEHIRITQEGDISTYISTEDPDFLPGKEDMSDTVLILSMSNNASYGSQFTSFQSILAGRSYAARDNKASSKGKG